MSLPELLIIAVAIPLCTIALLFLWFMIRAYFAQKNKGKDIPAPITPTYTNLIPVPNLDQMAQRHVRSVPQYITTSYRNIRRHQKPTYQPLSHYLDEPSNVLILQDTDIVHDLTSIPGITLNIQENLYELGYTCVEQIARWGRADVRAVSANLGIDQHQIEEQWVASARLILSLR